MLYRGLGAESRARYDAAVKGLRGGVGGKGGDADVVVGEEVVLEDMEECESEAGDLEYWYPCRCSDFFVVGSKELQNAGLGFGVKSSSGAFQELRKEMVVMEFIGTDNGSRSCCLVALARCIFAFTSGSLALE